MNKPSNLVVFLLFPMAYCCSFSAIAQVNLDSLWTIWNDKQVADTIRLQAMYDICEDRARSQPDSVLAWSDLMYKYSVQRQSEKYQAGALLQKGRAYSYKSDLKATEQAYNESLRLYTKIDYKYGIARVLAYTAGLRFWEGDYLEAIATGEKTIAIANEINNPKLSAGVAMVIGKSYEAIGNSARAVQIYENGMENSRLSKDVQTEAFHLHAMADIYLQQNNPQKSSEFHELSRQAYVTINDKLGLAGIIQHQSEIKLNEGDYDAAINGFNEAAKIYYEVGSRSGQADMLLMLANTYSSKEDYARAATLIEDAEKIAREIGHKELQGRLYLSKGKIYQSQKQFSKGIDWCLRGLKIFEELKHIGFQRDACECLYVSNKALNNGNEALAYHERYLLLNDSLQLRETAKKLQQVEFARRLLADSLQKEEEKHQLELAYQEQIGKEKTRRNAFMYGGIGILLLAGGLWSRLNYIRKSREIIRKEKDRSENLLLNILPAEVAEELKATGKAKAREFDLVSIIFTDFKEFTETAEKLSPSELVDEINYCFEGFDRILEEYGIEKIKTIGDAYMAAGGLPVANRDSVKNTVLAALKMIEFTGARKNEQESKGKIGFEMRCGVHSGPVVAGIVGVKKFQYDIWGDTVNTAARMESFGEAGMVNISQATYEIIKDEPGFKFTRRNPIEVKGKGMMDMYFVSLA